MPIGWIVIYLMSCFLDEATAYLYPFETPTAKYLKSIDITETASGLAPIDCIYVINLDERPEKWQHMKSIFKEKGLHGNRVSAINGWNLPSVVKQELKGPYKTLLSAGHIGCLLSHISVIKNAYDKNFKLIWILEDDVDIIGDIKLLPKFLQQLYLFDPNWDIFYTDKDARNRQGEYVQSLNVNPRPDQIIAPLEYFLEKIPICKDIMLIRNRFGTHSMLISRNGIEKILYYFTHVYLWMPIDIDIHYIPHIREYSTIEDFAIPIPGISDTSLDTILNPNNSNNN